MSVNEETDLNNATKNLTKLDTVAILMPGTSNTPSKNPQR